MNRGGGRVFEVVGDDEDVGGGGIAECFVDTLSFNSQLLAVVLFNVVSTNLILWRRCGRNKVGEATFDRFLDFRGSKLQEWRQ